MPADGPGLFTIGHSNQAAGDFLGLLQEHRIETVADVRTVPRSRYVPHFSAGPLREALAGRGIAYIPMGRELGGRPAGGEFYDGEGHVLYGRLAAAPAFRDGLDQVLAAAQTSRIALLCSEEDPARCHRHLLIGRVLRARGVPVSHIRRDGSVETEAELAANDPPPTLFEGGSRNSGSADSRSGDDGPAWPWRSPRPVLRRKPPPGSPAR